MTTITTIGRITKDFELKQSERSDCKYANFSIVVNDGFGDNQTTRFFECIAFNADAERLIKAKAKKGSLIQVTGNFSTKDYTRKNGEPGYSLKIAVHAWAYIPGTGGQTKPNENSENNESSNTSSAQAPDGGYEPYPADDDYVEMTNFDNDDLPF